MRFTENLATDRDGAVETECIDPGELVDHAVGLCVDAIRAAPVSHGRVERLFAELDEILLDLDDLQADAVQRDRRFSAIRERVHEVRATYEYTRELAAARQIVEAGRESAAEGFRSNGWYKAAQEFESLALAPFRCERILWIGAGPFPISAIYLQRADPGLSIVCVDRDAEACRLAREVVRIFDCPAIDVLHADALELSDFSGFDCVMVGLVVGVADREKQRVVEHYVSRVPPSRLLTFRSAVGCGTIIYPFVDLRWLRHVEHRLLPDPPHKLFSMIQVDRSDPQA